MTNLGAFSSTHISILEVRHIGTENLACRPFKDRVHRADLNVVTQWLVRRNTLDTDAIIALRQEQIHGLLQLITNGHHIRLRNSTHIQRHKKGLCHGQNAPRQLILLGSIELNPMMSLKGLEQPMNRCLRQRRRISQLSHTKRARL